METEGNFNLQVYFVKFYRDFVNYLYLEFPIASAENHFLPSCILKMVPVSD